MSPSINRLTRAIDCLSLSASTSSTPAALRRSCDCLSQQRRHASILGSLSDVPSSYNKRKRVGRGPASGYGKTSGRGHKGQGQHGGVPWHLRNPERQRELRDGQTHTSNVFKTHMSLLNVDTVQEWIDKGRIDPSKPVTLKELVESRCVHGIKDGIKLLARNSNSLRTPIDIIVSRASASAIAAVERAGGSVTTRYYAPRSIAHVLAGRTSAIASVDAIGGPLEAILPMSRTVAVDEEGNLVGDVDSATTTAVEGEAEVKATGGKKPLTKRVPMLPPFQYRLADPAGRRAREYYRNPANRGYLVHTVRKGEGPSLFFKPPPRVRVRSAAPGQAKKGEGEAAGGKVAKAGLEQAVEEALKSSARRNAAVLEGDRLF